MIQLYLNGQELELTDNQNITYTIQVNDLADVSKVNSSVTTSFSVPKTVNNIYLMQGLGLVGDTSTRPYVRNRTKLLYNYAELINSGWLIINNTDNENYNVNVENGIIDFFKAIEGKNIGKDLDLSDTNHNKDLVSVIDSFQRNDYCYIVADYNGLNTFKKGNTEYINTDYLVPSLNNKYLWDKIFTTFGFTYSGSVFTTEEFTNLWITYPKAPPISNEDNQELPEPITRFTSSKTNNIVFTEDFNEETVSFILDNTTLNGVTLTNNKITIQSNGTYKVSGSIDADAQFGKIDNWGNPDGYETAFIYLAIRLNGVFKLVTESLPLRVGDIVEFIGYIRNPPNNGYITGWDKTIFRSYNIKLEQTSQAVIDFGNELINLTISEYIKEIMIRFALTPIINTETNNIHFITLNERLNPSKVIDWSNRYVNRIDENYTYQDYAMNNLFKLKYNDPDANFNNGSITVNNLNLEQQKDLYTSKFYSYNREVTKFFSDDFVNNVFPLWDREIKETINNDTKVSTFTVNYKGLENRYYFIRRKMLNKNIPFGSQVLNVTDSKTNVAVSDVKNLSYAEMIVNKYSNFNRILNDVRIHNINLNVNINDLLNLDLTALYYFEQESQYYILNRINVDLNTNLAQGEFIRVNL